MMFRVIILLGLLSSLHTGADAAVSTACLDCICQVESGCRMPSPCCHYDVNSDSCGPFQIKQAYWTDANQWSPGTTGTSWNSCACGTSAMTCSRNAVQAYMERYGRESLIGHVPTCEDYARIHNGGPRGWSCSCTDAYWARVNACLNGRE